MGIETAAAALPDDVVLEVLARVADVAALFRCGAACKRWRRLIADRSFLRRRWPDNATHPSFLVGFFTQRRRHGTEDNEDEDESGDRDSPPVFIPAPGSVLGPGLRLRSSQPGLLDGAKPLSARGGLLLVRLASVVSFGPVRLAVCDALAGTCDELPPLHCESAPVSYAFLTGQDSCCPTAPAPNYSALFKVLAIGFVRRGDVECSLRAFSSADPAWVALGNSQLGGGSRFWPYVQQEAVVCHPPSGTGTAHWLCGDWYSDYNDTSNCFTMDVSPEDGRVSLAKLLLPAIFQPTEIYHLVAIDGTLSLLCLYCTKEGLLLETWARTNDAAADWCRGNRVIKFKQPENKCIDNVWYLWSGEKSGTLLIIDSEHHRYVACLQTGAVDEMTSRFQGMLTDVVPMEMDWTALFMSRLLGLGLDENL